MKRFYVQPNTGGTAALVIVADTSASAFELAKIIFPQTEGFLLWEEDTWLSMYPMEDAA